MENNRRVQSVAQIERHEGAHQSPLLAIERVAIPR
jgi:hypothetical protein